MAEDAPVAHLAYEMKGAEDEAPPRLVKSDPVRRLWQRPVDWILAVIGMEQIVTPAEYEWACERAESIMAELVRDHPDKAEQAKANPKQRGWFVGQIMKQCNGNGLEVAETTVRLHFESE